MHLNYVLYLVGTGVLAFVATYVFMELTHVVQTGTLGKIGRGAYTLLSLLFVGVFVFAAFPPLRDTVMPVWDALGYYPAEHVAQLVVAVVAGALGLWTHLRSTAAV